MALKMVLAPDPVVEIPPQKVLVAPTEATDVEVLTAEYIELHRKFDYFEVKTLVRRMDEIRKQLVAIANTTVEDNKPAVFTSVAGDVEFSERGKVADVPDPLALVQVLLEKFGPDVTASTINVAITPLRKILSEHELKQHLIELPGSRTLKAVRPVK